MFGRRVNEEVGVVQLVQASRVTDLDLAALRRLCDARTVERGQAYARQDKVLDIVPSGDRRRIHGTVEGSRAKPYAAWCELRDHPQRPGHSTWRSQCTCPVGADCKHVVALVLTAERRDAEARAGGLPPDPGGSWWQGMPPARHTGVLPLGGTGASVALQLTVAAPRPAAGADAGPVIQLTPLVQGARGWLRTGISWTGLDPTAVYGSVTADIDPLQEQALQEIAIAARARRTGHGSAALQRVSLDDLGPQAVPLLREVERSGVTLVDEQDRPVRLLERSGRFELRLQREDAGPRPAMILQPTLALPDELTGHETQLLGRPACAVLAQTRGGLLLTGLDPVLGRVEEDFLQREAIRVPEDEWSAFLLRDLPGLRRQVRVVLDPEAEDEASVTPRLLVQVTPLTGHRTEVELGWRYAVAGQPVDVTPLRRPSGLRAPRAELFRDRDAETEILTRLLRVLDPVLEPASAPRPWVAESLVTLDPVGTIALAGVLDQLRDDPDVVVEQTTALPDFVEARSAPVVSLGLDESEPDHLPRGRGLPTGAPRGATDWFDLDVSVSVDGEEVPLRELIVALRTRQEILVLPSGRWLRLEDERLLALAALLDEAAGLRDSDEGPLRVTALHAGLWDELVDLGVVDHQSERWRRTVDGLRGLDGQTRPVPRGLSATLRPYQHDGYQWLSLLWEARLGGILADDMGLGKTLQTLAMALRAKEQGDLADPLLIVAPTSVVGAWSSEAERWTPDLRVVTVDRTTRTSGVPLDRTVAGADVVVTSYALVRIDEAAYASRRWGGLVLDEAQFVKNHQAKTYQVVRKIEAGMKLAITGTPLENSLMDLWSLLSVTAPGLYPKPMEFRDTYVKPIEAGDGAELLATLRRRIRPLMLRRTKEQVARELPPKQEQVVAVPLTRAHRAVYDKHLQRERQRLLGLLDEDYLRNRFAILRALTQLRQLSLHPVLVDDEHAGTGESAKIDLLVEHLHELAAEGHRALVFSQFTGYLGLVRDRLAAEGIEHSYLDGRTRDRARRIEEFRSGEQTAFLISLKAGGFGLTLTEADYVYVLDPWWNPAAEQQAIDRTHRIGQDRPVTVYRFVSEDTIEDKVVALQQRKRELFTQVVDEGEALSAAISAADIRDLLA